MTDSSIFSHQNYKKFVLERLMSHDKSGRGQLSKLASSLNLPISTVSQVFNGDRNLTNEQIYVVADYLGLEASEADYFFWLVQLERAGNDRLTLEAKRNLEKIKYQASELDIEFAGPNALSTEERYQFYSNWYYMAVWLCLSLPVAKSSEVIAKKLNLPVGLVEQVIAFLIKCNLCVKRGDELEIGPRSVHLESKSPLVSRHHLNWRIKGLENVSRKQTGELFLSLAMTLSRADSEWVKRELIRLAKEVRQRVAETEPTDMMCLNIDWFEIK